MRKGIFFKAILVLILALGFSILLKRDCLAQGVTCYGGCNVAYGGGWKSVYDELADSGCYGPTALACFDGGMRDGWIWSSGCKNYHPTYPDPPYCWVDWITYSWDCGTCWGGNGNGDDPPDMPTSYNASCNDEGLATISWNAPSGTTYYKLRVDVASDPSCGPNMCSCGELFYCNNNSFRMAKDNA